MFNANARVFCRFLPENLSILGYARSKLSKKDLQEKVKPNLKVDYEAGPYDKPEGYQKVAPHSSQLPSTSLCLSSY